MILIVRNDQGVELGRVSVRDGEAVTEGWMVGVETGIKVYNSKRQLTPADGDAWLRALAAEFKHPTMQPFLEKA